MPDEGPSVVHLVSFWQASGMFPLGVITDEAAMGFLVQVFLCTWVFVSLEGIPRSGITES